MGETNLTKTEQHIYGGIFAEISMSWQLEE